MKIKYLPVSAMMALAIVACKKSEVPETDTAEVEQAVVKTDPVLGTFGVALENMDRSVDPGDDFYQYVNGGWLDRVEIPADKSRHGAFTILRDLSDERVKGIIETAAAKNAAEGTEEQKIGDFYAAFMDTDAIEAAGLDPVQADLERIKSVKTHEDVARIMGDPSLAVRSHVSGWVDVDVKDIDNYIFYMTQAGLGMPNRDYYLDDDEKSVRLREDYKILLTNMLTEAGVDNAAQRAGDVMALETRMAREHWTPTKRRDRSLTYNKMTLNELQDYAPGFPWQISLDEAGLGDQTNFVIRENDALQGTARIFGETPVPVWRDYMLASYMSGMSAYLPRRIDDADFAFYGKALRGTERQRDRWKRAVSQIDGYMGEMVGKVYVDRYFPPASKARMKVLVENLRAVFRDGIDGLEWMDEATKAEAQDKLRKFNPKIGYPEEWTDYSTLIVDRNDLIGTVKSANLWRWNDMIGKLGGPIDRDEWGMNPQTVNAYYRPSLNEIVFPAAILQAPFFDPNADPAVNYGGIGAVIGHEMGHGFDDQGRKTDGDGRQRDWWTEKDAERYEELAGALADQYDEFEPLPGENLNGRLGLGENIGDLTGITMAYAAYRRSLNGEEAPVIDGYTGDQRFFLAYGQIWAIKWREEALRAQVKTGPHSPGEFRANGIVRNFGPWYEAFDVTADDALYLPPEKRVKIW
ncbi:MAG: M13 family metallopeptidase [Hyphomonadaceae bacterium]|nr:M13 family metallopeptidase [Hyphomonadaceae bacterium]